MTIEAGITNIGNTAFYGCAALTSVTIPIVMAIDAANETAIIIFGDNNDMTAASFVGAIAYTDTTGTITDEANESTLTFGVTQVSEDTIELDMGDIGKATIKAESKETVLETIKNAIDNYEHIA